MSDLRTELEAACVGLLRASISGFVTSHEVVTALLPIIERHIQAAVADEREACAKKHAAAIRSRGKG